MTLSVEIPNGGISISNLKKNGSFDSPLAVVSLTNVEKVDGKIKCKWHGEYSCRDYQPGTFRTEMRAVSANTCSAVHACAHSRFHVRADWMLCR
jgi:hypothetical protein